MTADAERKGKHSPGLERQADLFKSLGSVTRLLMLNLIRKTPRHTEELASILRLSPATVSHHLGRLAAAGVIASEKEQYYQNYAVVEGVLDQTIASVLDDASPKVPAQAFDDDAYRRKVKAIFFQRGRLMRIPAQRKKLKIVLDVLADAFEPDEEYTERDVNNILAEYHEDVATLRRELVGYGYLSREHGLYWRVPRPGSPQDDAEAGRS